MRYSFSESVNVGQVEEFVKTSGGIAVAPDIPLAVGGVEDGFSGVLPSCLGTKRVDGTGLPPGRRWYVSKVVIAMLPIIAMTKRSRSPRAMFRVLLRVSFSLWQMLESGKVEISPLVRSRGCQLPRPPLRVRFGGGIVRLMVPNRWKM